MARRPVNPLRPFGLALMLSLAGAAQAEDLVELYRLAIERDATYLAARAAAEGGREIVPQARAGLLPQVSANLSLSRNSTDQTSKDILGREVSRQYDYTAEGAALTLRQALYRPAALAQWKAAESRVNGIDAQLEKERQNVAMRLAQAYFDVLLARERIKSLQSEQEAYRAQLEAAERAFRAGFGTRTDIDDARARLDLAQAREIEAKQSLAVAERALSALIAEPVQADRLQGLKATGPELGLPEPADLQAWIQRAEENNPELKAWRAAVAAAEYEIQKNRAGHLPSVELFASRSLSDSESDSTIGSRYWTTRIGAQVVVPLYAGGYVDSTVRQALANRDSARQQLEAARRQIGVEVTRAYGAVTQGIARIKALEVALNSAEQAVRSSQKGLAAGTRSRVDVLNALQQEAAVRYELYRARIDTLLGQLRLMQMSGLLEESELARVNQWLTGPEGRS